MFDAPFLVDGSSAFRNSLMVVNKPVTISENTTTAMASKVVVLMRSLLLKPLA